MVKSWSDVGSRVRVATVALALGAGALIAACDSPLDVPGDATQFSPPAVYQRWWSMTQACAGRARSLNAVRWYHVPGSHFTVNGQDVRGYFNARDNTIILSDSLAAFAAGVRHEMLHAVLDFPGHPRDMYQGFCANAVTCPGACATDGGQWTAPSPWVPMEADSLVVSAVATLMDPEVDGDRWLVIRVRAKNPLTRAIVVDMPGTQTFSFTLASAASGALVQDAMTSTDTSAVYFAPTETKEFVFELQVGDTFTRYSVPPGDYQYSVGFGPRSSSWASVNVMRLQAAGR